MALLVSIASNLWAFGPRTCSFLQLRGLSASCGMNKAHSSPSNAAHALVSCWDGAVGWAAWCVAVCYLLGALCWITNAYFAGWPSAHALFNTYLLGFTSIAGASLFQVGAVCQLLQALDVEPADLDVIPWHCSPRTPRAAGVSGSAASDSAAAAARRTSSVPICTAALSLPPHVLVSANSPQPAVVSAFDATGLHYRCHSLPGPDSGPDSPRPDGSSPTGGSPVSVFSVETLFGEDSSLLSHGRHKVMHGRQQHHNWGYRAAVTQVVGTTIFLGACVCGFPGVLPTDLAAGDWVYWDAFYWAPFLLGSCLFISSAVMSMLQAHLHRQHEQQAHKPCDGWPACQQKLVWWVSLANILGSVGFWLCSFFGFFAYPAQRYQRWGMAFSCLWGSCCFALGAGLQLLECIQNTQAAAA